MWLQFSVSRHVAPRPHIPPGWKRAILVGDDLPALSNVPFPAYTPGFLPHRTETHPVTAETFFPEPLTPFSEPPAGAGCQIPLVAQKTVFSPPHPNAYGIRPQPLTSPPQYAVKHYISLSYIVHI